MQTSPHKLGSNSSLFLSSKRLKHIHRNNTLDSNAELAKIRPNCIHRDKEALFDELIQLKQDNNQLRLQLKHSTSQLQYYKRELCTKDGSRSSSNLKVGYMEKIVQLEDQIVELQGQLQEANEYMMGLQQPFTNSLNAEKLCLSLQQDNIKLTQIMQQHESSIKNLQNLLIKSETNYNAIQYRFNQQKKLSMQLQDEVAKLKKRDTLFLPRPILQSQKNDETVQLELDQAQINLRNAEKKISNLEGRITQIMNESAEHIETLEKRVIELSKKNEAQMRQFDEEKSTYQRNSKRTIMIKSEESTFNNAFNPMTDILKPKRQNTMEKVDLLQVVKLMKLRLIGSGISLSDVDNYLLQGENMTLRQISDNLRDRVFGLQDDAQVYQVATYLADTTDETERTPCARVRSIFRTLMENYVLITSQEMRETNNSINRKRTEISDQIMKKYPDTYQSGLLDLDTYLNILSTQEIQLSKSQIEHIQAHTYRRNGRLVIFLQQLFNPLDYMEKSATSIHHRFNDMDLPPINIIMEATENILPVATENQLPDNPMGESDGDDEGQSERSDEQQNYNDGSVLDIKMVNSQELRKKSQTDLQQF